MRFPYITGQRVERTPQLDCDATLTFEQIPHVPSDVWLDEPKPQAHPTMVAVLLDYDDIVTLVDVVVRLRDEVASAHGLTVGPLPVERRFSPPAHYSWEKEGIVQPNHVSIQHALNYMVGLIQDIDVLLTSMPGYTPYIQEVSSMAVASARRLAGAHHDHSRSTWRKATIKPDDAAAVARQQDEQDAQAPQGDDE